jgi:glycosyltransferase involved in cell wall biosynthesis
MPSIREKAEVSIVIPTRNEKDRVGNAVFLISQFFHRRGISYEILLVDEGSESGATEAAEKLARHLDFELRVVRNEGGGRGESILRGAESAAGERLLWVGADLPVQVEELEKLLNALEAGADIALGKEEIQGPGGVARAGKPPGLFSLAAGAHAAYETLYEGQIPKGFRPAVLSEIFQRAAASQAVREAEVIFLAEKSGCRIAEVPVSFRSSFPKRLSLLRRSGVFPALLKMRLKLMLGRYAKRV